MHVFITLTRSFFTNWTIRSSVAFSSLQALIVIERERKGSVHELMLTLSKAYLSAFGSDVLCKRCRIDYVENVLFSIYIYIPPWHPRFLAVQVVLVSLCHRSVQCLLRHLFHLSDLQVLFFLSGRFHPSRRARPFVLSRMTRRFLAIRILVFTLTFNAFLSQITGNTEIALGSIHSNITRWTLSTDRTLWSNFPLRTLVTENAFIDTDDYIHEKSTLACAMRVPFDPVLPMSAMGPTYREYLHQHGSGVDISTYGSLQRKKSSALIYINIVYLTCRPRSPIIPFEPVSPLGPRAVFLEHVFSSGTRPSNGYLWDRCLREGLDHLRRHPLPGSHRLVSLDVYRSQQLTLRPTRPIGPLEESHRLNIWLIRSTTLTYSPCHQRVQWCLSR